MDLLCRYLDRSQDQPPTVDAQQDITNTKIMRNGDVTSMKFIRPRVSTDTSGNDVNLDGCRYFGWVYGDTVYNYSDPTTISRPTRQGAFSDRICVPESCDDGGELR